MCIRDRLKTLFAHADKKRAEIEALERKRGKAMETPEYSLIVEENYLDSLREIYEKRLKGDKKGKFRPVSYTHLDVYKRQPK